MCPPIKAQNEMDIYEIVEDQEKTINYRLEFLLVIVYKRKNNVHLLLLSLILSICSKWSKLLFNLVFELFLLTQISVKSENKNFSALFIFRYIISSFRCKN